jgi:general secretion pathway protein K
MKPSSFNLQKRQQRRSGIALLVAITTIAILTVIVTEVTYIARMRLLTASNQRDRVQAYWLAKSGTGIYQLILAANKELGRNSFIQEFGLGDSLWQMVPALNTGMMRMLFVSDAPGDDVEKEDIEEFKEDGRVSEAVMEKSREGGLFSDRNFLDFPGDFSAEIIDMESKIDINQLGSEGDSLQESTTGQRLYSLMSGEENDQWFLERNIDRWEIIGNIKDWVDADDYRSGGLGGQEDSLYQNQDPPYYTKNAKFDTTDEVRLIDGWNGEVFDKFGDKLTIWSNGKFNLTSLDKEMHKALIRSAANSQPQNDMLNNCLAGTEWMMGITFVSKAKDYADFVQNTCGIELDKTKLTNITKTSKVFEITSTGMVGTSTVTMSMIIDFTRSSLGTVRYIRIE